MTKVETFKLKDMVLVANTTPPLIKANLENCEELEAALRRCVGNNITLLHNGTTYTALSKDTDTFNVGCVTFTFKTNDKVMYLTITEDNCLQTTTNSDSENYWDIAVSFDVDIISTATDKPKDIMLTFSSGNQYINLSNYEDKPISCIDPLVLGHYYTTLNDQDQVKAIDLASELRISGVYYTLLDRCDKGSKHFNLYKADSTGEKIVMLYDWFTDEFMKLLSQPSPNDTYVDFKQLQNIDGVPLVRVYKVQQGYTSN